MRNIRFSLNENLFPSYPKKYVFRNEKFGFKYQQCFNLIHENFNIYHWKFGILFNKHVFMMILSYIKLRDGEKKSVITCIVKSSSFSCKVKMIQFLKQYNNFEY